MISHYITSHYITLHHITLHHIHHMTLNYHHITLHYITLTFTNELEECSKSEIPWDLRQFYRSIHTMVNINTTVHRTESPIRSHAQLTCFCGEKNCEEQTQVAERWESFLCDEDNVKNKKASDCLAWLINLPMSNIYCTVQTLQASRNRSWPTR